VPRDVITSIENPCSIQSDIAKWRMSEHFVMADGRCGRVVAMRHYDDDHPDTGERFRLRDHLVIWGHGTHSLFVAGELPGDMPFERQMTLEEVFEWYQEEDGSAYIERVVVQGAGELPEKGNG
jgi:hypothetical protein